MHLFSKRDILRYVGLAGGGLGVPFRASVGGEAAACQDHGPRRRALSGFVHGLGVHGRLFPGSEAGPEKGVNIITSLNLTDGSVRQTPVLMSEGHSAMSMGDRRILCLAQHERTSLVLDPKHKTIARLAAPEHHVYSGHGLMFPDRNIFAVTLHHELQLSPKDFGLIHVHDLTSLRLLDEISTDGLQPHEIHPIPNSGELALTHYGDIFAERKPFEHNVVDAKLTILDAATFRPKRHYPQPDFNAMVTHMRVDKDGWAYFVLTQYIKWPKLLGVRPDSDPFATASQLLDEITGRKRDYPLPYRSLEERNFPLPLPFVRVNTQTGERQIVDAGDRNHLRSQSVAYSAETGLAVALYYQSDNLVIHRPGTMPDIISGADLHLNDIRGVTEIPGTPLIAVMGTYRGISILDLTSRELVATYPTLNYGDTHLYYDAATGT